MQHATKAQPTAKPVNPYHLTRQSRQFLRAVGAEHRRRNMARRAARDRVAQWGLQ